MISLLCILIPAQLGNFIFNYCNPASAYAPASAPTLAVDGTQLAPLHTSSRWILDSNNQRVKLRCVNWAGHLETNIPEGMNHQTPEYLANWIANAGFNCVRLTYSIDMAIGGDVSVEQSFIDAANSTGTGSNLTDIYDQALQVNPWLASATTQGVFAAVISALGDKGVRVILDNHLSKAGWCCNPTDGNSWWDADPNALSLTSRFFNTTNWLTGLGHMAGLAARHPNVVGMSLRNELYALGLEDLGDEVWFEYTQKGAQAIRDVNPNVFVVFGGTEAATNLSWLRYHQLDKSAWNGENMTIYENHVYTFSYLDLTGNGNCDEFNLALGASVGFVLEQNEPWTGPMWTSEFGLAMTGGPNDGISNGDQGYLTCLVDYMTANDADWAIWALQGSYYIREGTVNYVESYGMLDSQFKDWQNPKFPAKLGAMWNITQGP